MIWGILIAFGLVALQAVLLMKTGLRGHAGRK